MIIAGHLEVGTGSHSPALSNHDICPEAWKAATERLGASGAFRAMLA